jgi:hypothetical protein
MMLRNLDEPRFARFPKDEDGHRVSDANGSDISSVRPNMDLFVTIVNA